MINIFMKKFSTLTTLLLAICMLTACNNSKPSQPIVKEAQDSAYTPNVENEKEEAFSTKKLCVEIADSVKGEYGNEAIATSVKIDWPVSGDAKLQESVCKYITHTLSMGYKTGDDPQKAINAYVKAKQKEQHANSKEFEGPITGRDFSAEITLTSNTPKYITYIANTYIFLGGAHGSTFVEGATFSKKDGHKLSYDMFASNIKKANDKNHAKLMSMIVKDLKKYFEVKTDQELLEILLLNKENPTIKDIPLPQMVPFFDKDGITFIYQQYEIAPYAAGMPQVTIPFSKIKPLLNEAAQELVP